MDYFRTVRVEFSGLFLDSPDRIFGTVFKQSGTDFWTVCVLFILCVIENFLNNVLVVIPGLKSSSFVVCFGIIVIR